jgi:hypothetical protein
MTEDQIAAAAHTLTENLLDYHADLLVSDTDQRDAVIRKTIALVALAFDIPPTADGHFDIDEIIQKLRESLEVIAVVRRPH